ncbi:MAG: hypothetical protein LUH48_00990, partial [Clostridiales bacterium]|nr:hypothetical protein [Clostridiales bacterium]
PACGPLLCPAVRWVLIPRLCGVSAQQSILYLFLPGASIPFPHFFAKKAGTALSIKGSSCFWGNMTKNEPQ